jgi:hypothetical protein
MRIELRTTAGRVGAFLVDAQDFTSFSVDVAPDVKLADAPPEVRIETAEQAWVARDWLVRAGGFDSGPAAESFAAMVGYATRNGWVDPATGAIAGHITHGSPGTRS